MGYARGKHPNSRNGFKHGHKPYYITSGKLSEETKKKISVSLKGRKHTSETRKKISLAVKGKRKGEKSNFWKGGVTPINRLIRESTEYKTWREAVLKRDDYTCRFCLQKGIRLEADHIKPFAFYPELRFALDNGRTLCIDCHRKTDTYGINRFKNKIAL